LRMDFDSTEAGNLLVKQNGPELLASFAARPDRVYVLESSPDLTRWDPVETGVTSGIMQLLSVGINPEQPAQFFRIRLNPEVDP
ncbi:MAG TPA: hypothetical protein VLD18_13105, partial [Verrucomicrobiae bacterium]|nr:hypothetical protein [Verrucomicrobiae bacterium]